MTLLSFLILPSRRLALCGAAFVSAALASLAQISTSVTADADTYLRDDTDRGAMEFMDIRDVQNFYGYLRFDLSGLNIESVVSATVSLQKVDASRSDTLTTGRFRLMGLTDAAGNTSQTWVETGSGALNTTNVGTEDRLTLTGLVDLNGETVAGVSESIAAEVITVSGDPLTAFVQSRVDGGGYVTFVIDFPPAGQDRGYGLATKENTSGALVPTLNLVYLEAAEQWQGFPVVDGGWADTGLGNLGWLYVEFDPWIYSASLNGWFYIPAGFSLTEGGGNWIFLSK